MTGWLFWLAMTFFWSACMSFFSTQEMACISYNRLKLEVQARAGLRQAKWIQGLLRRPTSLFGTTLVGVNLCLVITSECMRQFFSSLSLNPNLSVFLLVPYLVLFGELIPMFAARTFPEHTAKLGSPIIWFFSVLISPFAYMLESILRFCFKPWMSKQVEQKSSLFQHEELQEMLRPLSTPKREEEDPSAHLFLSIQKMREKSCSTYMTQIQHVLCLSVDKNVTSALNRLRFTKTQLATVSTKQKKIIGLVTDEQLLLANQEAELQSILSSIPFVHCDEKASDILARMIHEEVPYSFVINEKGDISGILSIDALLEDFMPRLHGGSTASIPHISKTVDACTKIGDFFKKYDLPLQGDPDEQFSSYITRVLDRKPKVGERVLLGPLEITVRETSLRGIKRIFIQSLS